MRFDNRTFTGQERFTSMTRVYYKDATACVIIFDLTQKKTFQNAVKWKKDLDSKCTLPDGSPVPCILLANKVNIHSSVFQFLRGDSAKACQLVVLSERSSQGAFEIRICYSSQTTIKYWSPPLFHHRGIRYGETGCAGLYFDNFRYVF